MSLEEIQNGEEDSISFTLLNNLELEEPWRSLAIKKVNEQPELNAERVADLASSLKRAYPSLNVHTDPSFLLRFLRLRKFDQAKAYKTAAKYYKFRRDEKLCWDLRPSECEHIFKLQIGAIMPGYDLQMRKLFIVHVGQWDTKAVLLWDALRAALMVLDVIANDAVTQITGFAVIIDFKGFGWKQLSQVTFDLAKVLVRTIEDTVPMRIKALYFINASPVLTSLVSTIKLLLSSKIKKRFYVLSEKNEDKIKSDGKQQSPNQNAVLCEEFGPNILPAALGGVLESNEVYEQSTHFMLQHESYFEYVSQFGFPRER